MAVIVDMPQIADDETVEAIDAFLRSIEGWVQVRGNIDDRAMGLRVGGYRDAVLKPLILQKSGDQDGEIFDRTCFNSMTFEFERTEEASEFHDRFS